MDLIKPWTVLEKCFTAANFNSPYILVQNIPYESPIARFLTHKILKASLLCCIRDQGTGMQPILIGLLIELSPGCFYS